MPLPVPLANLSLWQRTVQSHPLLKSNAPLPESSDIVIIGGGMCGAVIAHALLHPEEHVASQLIAGLPSGPKPTVTLLEARDLASGASGRNAGHCRPDAARGFPLFAKLQGEEQAKHILESEREVFNRVDAFVKKHGIDCEWTPRTTYDIFLSPEFAEHSRVAVDAYRDAGGRVDLTEKSPEEAAKAFPTKSYGATAWPAGTLNPAKLTLGVLGLCEGLVICGNTPVLGVTGEEGAWKVSTPKGEIEAKKVVWATNAYGGHGLEGLITPIVAQAHKLSKGAKLEGSYSLRYSQDVFYSVAPRSDDSVVLGTSLGSGPVNTGVNDSSFSAERARRALRAWEGMLPKDRVKIDETDGLDEAAKVPGSKDEPVNVEGVKGLEYAWTGVIGFTPDMVPLVGDIPGLKGQYVAAGYCGHGMARIFLTAPTLAKYVTTGEWDSAMPSCFHVTPERVERLKKMEWPAVVRRATPA